MKKFVNKSVIDYPQSTRSVQHCLILKIDIAGIIKKYQYCSTFIWSLKKYIYQNILSFKISLCPFMCFLYFKILLLCEINALSNRGLFYFYCLRLDLYIIN